MSDEIPQGDPTENGVDGGSGDPNDDRAFLMDQAPVDAGGDGAVDDADGDELRDEEVEE